ncbi:prepilin-type N-terminal cleavage/methylation domain-containing protein [Primorskyibacter sp. 2E107]|uniref:prepilin-type N-terminal cleavage/methylation domain-containing protein n=1 Tax=Primorskyibacter sp. 2E107 TaxID=3403458 RepID=UPI003AF87C8E
MDPAITRHDANQDAGFTLIELLVSVAILSILAVGASLALSRGSAARETDMALFQARYETARQLAILGQQSRGLEIGPDGLRGTVRDFSGWQKPGQLQRWRGRVTLSARPSAGPGVPAPDIVFLASGQTNAFRVAFGASGTCASDGWSGLTCSGR